MASQRRPRSERAFLRIEHLEDRTVPSGLGYNSALPLAPQVAAGVISPDHLIVLMNDTTGATAPAATAGVRQVHPIGFGMYSVRLQAGADLGTALAYYAAQPGVSSVEPDQYRQADRKPNDTSYASQYGPARIGAETVWNTTTGNANFVVGVIDSGIDYTHPDLAANIWTNPGEIPGNGIDDDGNGYVDDVRGWDFANDDNDPMDVDGHGTHVAGIIGAVGNNARGVTGVNWNVKLMPLNFLGAGPNSGLISAEAEAIHYAVMMGVKVTNNSYGGLGTSQAEARAVGFAQFAGQIYVASAGNTTTNNDASAHYPSNFTTSFSHVVAVAATDSTDKLGSFSNYGSGSVTLAAPGVGILSTTPGNSYSSFDGTSMATPQVTGAIALYWGANPTLSYEQVINKLKASVDPVAGLVGKVSTGGRLNVAKMFASPPVPPVVVGAPAGTDVVRVLAAGGATQMALTPHPGYLGGVGAAAGDVTGDGTPDIVTPATFGGHVKVFNGATGREVRSFYGFPGYRGPISVAVGDLTGDGVGDIIISANTNGHVKVFNGLTGQLTFSALVYQGYVGAVAVAAADLDGDGRNELLTGADAGFGVHVKGFTAGTIALRDSFLATGPGSSTNFSLAAADLDLDGVPELLVSQGAQVRVMNARTKAVRADFLAVDPLTTDRGTVQAAKYTGDPSAELVVISQAQGRSQVQVFDGADFTLTDSFVAGSR